MDQPLTAQQELEQLLAAEQKLAESGQPPDSGLVMRRAELLADRMRWQDSLAACEEFLALSGNPDPKKYVDLLVLRAMDIVMLGRADEALQACDHAERICEELGIAASPYISTVRGNAFYRLVDFDNAMAALDESMRRYASAGQPVHPWTHLNRGIVYVHTGRYDAGQRAFNESEQAYIAQGLPVHPGIAANRALLMVTMGRYEDALLAFADSRRRNAEQELPDSPVVPVNEGWVLERLGRYGEALEAYDRSEQLFVAQGIPVFPGLPANRGSVYEKLGRYEDALLALDESERMYLAQGIPVHPDVEVGRAVNFGKLGRYDEAMAAYARASEMATSQGIGDEWEWYFRRAITMYEAGRREDAISEIYRAISLCGKVGVQQPGFLMETLRDWMSPKPEKLVEEQITSQPQAIQPVPDNEKKHDVFICYRRDPGLSNSMLLQAHMDIKRKTVFRDQDGLSSGRFEDGLKDAIRYSRHMVLLMTPGFFNRCLDGKDVVRKEIATALHCGTHIIPVMMEGFVWPAEEELPEDIRAVAGINAMSWSTEFFTAFIDKLLKWME
ncbi:MAG: tetratricopeptide repeat protein [Planctomycetales bacterium]|nr:tetratricopeptide repeat protein [bacterium]UNM09338.1 MAG: tetratricopeptide repeat protein [Planctomycetales bacterium]